jgi:hypothetical protein
MKITNEISTSHAKLSNSSARFLEFVEKNPESLKQANFDILELNDDLFKLQAWPTFINRKIVNEMVEASTGTFELIKCIPGRFFDNDPCRISRYFEISEDLAKQSLQGLSNHNVANLISRGDFTLTLNGLKCLEYNVSCNLGGWQVPLWESMYLNTPIITDFLKEYRIKIVNKNLIFNLLDHAIQAALDKFYDGIDDIYELNAALVFLDEEDIKEKDYHGMELYTNQLYKKSLKMKNERLKGKVKICAYRELEVFDDYLFFRDKKIHILIEMSKGRVPPEIMDVFVSGNICLFNGPISRLLSNKLTLALLSQHENSDLLSAEERETVKKYIPWTRKVYAHETHCGDKKINLEDFILLNKDKLVLKPGEGYGGTGIYIGLTTSTGEWAAAVKSALKEKCWIIQEYVRSHPYLYQAGENGCLIHDAIWGFFVFGTRYGGEWVRVMPRKDSKGVINCHQGATVSIIFEVDE